MSVCQNIPMTLSKYQKPCFESSPSEHWPYHDSHGHPYPYHPCCHNNSFPCCSGFQNPLVFTPQPMRCYGDHYLYPEMYNFYPPCHHMDHIREFDNDTEKPRNYRLFGHPMNSKQHMSHPYPFLWVSPEFMRSKELKNLRADMVKEDKVSNEADHKPKAWDESFPIDMDALSSLLESEKEKGVRQKEGKREFLFPKFWIPSYHEQTENPKGEEKIHEKKISPDDVPYTIMFIPLNQPGKDGSENNLKSEEAHKGSSKNENIESLGEKGRRRSLSPPKTSKPAPACLRVDPSPIKRKQTRFSSPPASGPRENYRMLEERTGDLNMSKQVEPDREKIVKVVDVKNSECRMAEFPMISQLEPQNVVSKINCEVNNNEEGQKMVDDEMKSHGAAEPITSEASMKKITSDEKAAKLIQSVYRGYAVRKWDSLKKMKQLSEVKKHVVDVRNRVKNLQFNYPGDEKEKMIIGELLMRLLLKLDTIQGLIPFVREVRKSLAKELVMLQGMVDDISMIHSGKSTEENVAICEEKSSEEVMEVPMMVNVFDELVLDCPTKSLGSDDAKPTSDEAASVFETNKNVREAGVTANKLIIEGETELEESSCQRAGEVTIAVDIVNNGQIVPLEDGTMGSSPSNIVERSSKVADVVLNPGAGEGVPMTSNPEEEEEAATVESFSHKLTPIVVDALISKEEEQKLEVGVIESSTLYSRNLIGAEADAVLEQNHHDDDFLQVSNDSVCDGVINDMPMVLLNGDLRSAENEEIVATVNQTEVSELVKSETVQFADVFGEVIAASDDNRLEKSQAEVVKEERTIALDDESEHSQQFEVEENKEAKELTDEEEETETSMSHFFEKSESTEEEMEGEQEVGNGKNVKENEQLREMIEKLMEVGKEQVILISNLSCRVKELEKQLKKKKKKRMLRSKLLANGASSVAA